VAERTQTDPAVGHPDAIGAFEAFYRAEVDRVYRALAVTLGDPYLAREATDEAMARAYAHWRRVSVYDNPGGWVFRVGLNWATSWWRKFGREHPTLEPPLLGSDRAATAEPQDAGIAAAFDALGRLPIGQRAVVVCRVLLDLTTVETAAVLGVAEGTVKSRLARGLLSLRRVLGDEQEETNR
jgi:RNA polymerase sigma factor (sigma-70 family)